MADTTPLPDERLAEIRASVTGRALCEPGFMESEEDRTQHVWGPGQFTNREICVICHVTREWAEEETAEKVLLAEIDRLKAELVAESPKES